MTLLAIAVLSAWAAGMHPSGSSYAVTGQGARVGFYQINDADEDAAMNGDESKEGAGSLQGECVKLMETGRGKFGMDLCYVSSEAAWCMRSLD
jgi:hypothetical protein